MDLQVWLAFLVASCLIALSPGSGAVLSMSHGLAYGVRQTTATIIGLQIGLAFVLLVAGAGVGALLLASATAFLLVKIIGAAYLLWLGWRQWCAPVAVPADPVGAAQSGLSVRERIVVGMLTNATNPKSIVFNVAVLPQFIDPNRPVALQLAILLITSICVDLVVMHAYAALAARLSTWLRSVRARRAQNRVFGGVLMGMGAGLLMVDRVARTA